MPPDKPIWTNSKASDPAHPCGGGCESLVIPITFSLQNYEASFTLRSALLIREPPPFPGRQIARWRLDHTPSARVLRVEMKVKKKEYASYLQSSHWQQRRRIAIEHSGPTCERCGFPRWLSQIAYSQDLHVHHLSYENLGAEPEEDLSVLCVRCHEVETFGRTDIKEPKRATCLTCQREHWDVYSDTCTACAGIIALDFPLGAVLNTLDPLREQPVWKTVVSEFVFFLFNWDVDPEEVRAWVRKQFDSNLRWRAQAQEKEDVPF